MNKHVPTAQECEDILSSVMKENILLNKAEQRGRENILNVIIRTIEDGDRENYTKENLLWFLNKAMKACKKIYKTT